MFCAPAANKEERQKWLRSTWERIFVQIAAFAQTRDLFRVSEEWYAGMQQAELELFCYRGGEMQREKLAECECHGRWLKFTAPGSIMLAL